MFHRASLISPVLKLAGPGFERSISNPGLNFETGNAIWLKFKKWTFFCHKPVPYRKRHVDVRIGRSEGPVISSKDAVQDFIGLSVGIVELILGKHPEKNAFEGTKIRAPGSTFC
jgi:hypothetical protein